MVITREDAVFTCCYLLHQPGWSSLRFDLEAPATKLTDLSGTLTGTRAFRISVLDFCFRVCGICELKELTTTT